MTCDVDQENARSLLGVIPGDCKCAWGISRADGAAVAGNVAVDRSCSCERSRRSVKKLFARLSGQKYRSRKLLGWRLVVFLQINGSEL